MTQGLSYARSVPQSLDNQWCIQGKGADEFEIPGESRQEITLWFLALFTRIDNVQAADSGNRAAQPDEMIAIQSVRPAEVVDDPGNGLSGHRVALIVGQLIVLDDGTVFVFSLSSPEVHGCLHV